MSKEKPIPVTMTATGRVKEYSAGTDIQAVLESVYAEHQSAGSNWDRPEQLFIGGKCVVPTGLTDLAWEYGKFLRQKGDELDAALGDWVDQHFNRRAAESA